VPVNDDIFLLLSVETDKPMTKYKFFDEWRFTVTRTRTCPRFAAKSEQNIFHLLSQPPEDRAKLYKSSNICETTIPHTHTPTAHTITPSHHYTITSSHQLIFTHTMNTTKHSSSSLPKSGTTSPLISLHCDEYVYPPTTN